MQSAPYHQLPDDGSTSGTAFWTAADDGVRLRMVVWRSDDPAPRGSILLFPGRTEYAEKYAPYARLLNARGYDVLGLDWRGQGLSDRLQADPRPGHIGDFADYQRDVVEIVVAAEQLELPKPWHLLAHSMGGCIGLAALYDQLPVASAAFSAPMWGIHLHGLPTFAAKTLSTIAGRLGLGGRSTPGSGARGTYFVDESFGANLLTCDVDEWARLLREAASWPDLTIGGASFDWVGKALGECARLAALPSPDLPMLVSLGSEEKVVSPQAIRDRAARWDGAQLLEIDGGRHEVMMETPDRRRLFLDAITRHFDANG